MWHHRIRVLTTGLLLTALGGIAAPAWALPLDIAQSPLFLSTRVKPGFLMVIDDSGSMNWETLFAAADGQGFWGRDNTSSPYSFYTNSGTARQSGSGDFLQLFPYPSRSTDRNTIPATPNFGFARSPQFNPAYYDPAVFYEPWRNADGTNQANTSITAAPVNRLPLSGTTFDLTANRAVSTNTTDRFDYRTGMVIPAGARYHLGGNSCSGISGSTSSWLVAASDMTVTATSCTIAIDYFPATYFLTTNTSPDGNTAPVAFANQPNATPATLYRYEIKSANYASTAAYNAAIQNFANWFSYYRTRHLAVRGGISIALTGVDFLRTGLFTINSLTNPVAMRDLALATDRGALYSTNTGGIFRTPGNGGTPNRQAVNHAGTQFQRTGSTAPVQLACQVNAAMLFTDGFSNAGSVAVGNVDGSMGAPFADGHSDTMADIASKYYLANIRPDLEAGKMVVPSLCNNTNPDPRLDCRRDPHVNFYGVTLGSFGNVFGVDAAATADPFTNTPAWPSMQDNNRTTVDDIWHGTVNTRGKMLNASTPQAITTAIRDVINAVLDSAQDSGTLALTGARVGANSFTVSPSFSVGNNGTDWSGRLTAFRVNADGGVGTQLWEASNQLPNSPATAAARKVLVATVPGGSSTKNVVNFVASNLGATTSEQFAAMGITPTDIAVNFPTATPTQVVDYLRGDTSLELPSPGPFRERTTRLGDIVGSTPEISSPQDDFGYGSTLSGALATSYQTYLEGKATNVPMVYVGANDGMFHGFNGNLSGSGREEFAFIPNAALKRIGALASRRYDHRYYVDGPVTVADTQLNSSWGSVVVGTGGAGTRTVFAIDVTDPTSVDATDVLWEINDSVDADMGFALGKPQVLPVTGGQWVALVPNGYNSGSENAALFVVDIDSGQILKKLVPNDGSDEANGLGNIVALDNDGDGFADAVYGGDLQGNIWKFDLSSASPSSWNVAFGGNPLFTATDSAGARQAVTGGFDVTTGPGGNNMLLFGTGRFFVNGDNAVAITHQVETFYSVLDDGTSVSGGRSDLAVQTIASEQTVSVPNPNPPPANITGTIRNITQQNVNFATQRGWLIDLVVGSTTPKGERFIGNPRVQNGKVFFTTFEPQGDACTPGGKNFLYGLDAITGGAALNQVSIGDPHADAICTSCGAINILEGAPVRDTILTVPTPPTIAGLDCEIGTSGCEPPDPNDPVEKCTLVLQTPGGQPIFLPRACGRQSWRQLE